MTVWDKLAKIPPCIVRVLARTANGRRGLSHGEIAKLSGLSVGTVGKLSLQTSWDSVTLSVARRFSAACGVDHLNAKRQLDYLRRRKMTHVSRGDKNQQRFYNRLFVVVAGIKSTHTQ